MNRFCGLASSFEAVLEKGDDLTSIWGPLRRMLPPREITLGMPFMALWTAYTVTASIVGAMLALLSILMFGTMQRWSSLVTTGRVPFWSIVSYYAGWVIHHLGFFLFYVIPALVIALGLPFFIAWNLRARRLQKGGAPRELKPAPDEGVWPPPPANRK